MKPDLDRRCIFADDCDGVSGDCVFGFDLPGRSSMRDEMKKVGSEGFMVTQDRYMLSAEYWDWVLFVVFSLLWFLCNVQYGLRVRSLHRKAYEEKSLEKRGWEDAQMTERVKTWQECT